MIVRLLMLCLLFVGCTTKNKTNCDALLSDTFLQVVDTFGYKTFSLRPAIASDTLNYLKEENNGKYPSIAISDSLISFETQREKIKPIINSLSDSSKIFLSLKAIVNNDRILMPCFSTSNLSSYFPEKIGKFVLTFSKIAHSPKNGKLIGAIRFSNVVGDKEGRYFMYYIVITDGIKSGVEKLILVERIENIFKVLKEIDIYVW